MRDVYEALERYLRCNSLDNARRLVFEDSVEMRALCDRMLSDEADRFQRLDAKVMAEVAGGASPRAALLASLHDRLLYEEDTK